MVTWGKEQLALAGMAPKTRGAAAAPEGVDELAPRTPAAGSEIVPGGRCVKDVGKIGILGGIGQPVRLAAGPAFKADWFAIIWLKRATICLISFSIPSIRAATGSREAAVTDGGREPLAGGGRTLAGGR